MAEPFFMQRDPMKVHHSSIPRRGANLLSLLHWSQPSKRISPPTIRRLARHYSAQWEIQHLTVGAGTS